MKIYILVFSINNDQRKKVSVMICRNVAFYWGPQVSLFTGD